MKALATISMLIMSNIFMTIAWYGHLKWFNKWNLIWVILISWGFASIEYVFQVPANKLGFEGNGGPFSLVQLKVIQEVITLIVFSFFSVLIFHAKLTYNHLIGFCLLILAVYFIFKK
ncbi:MAG: DMT family protein [Flavobacteriales bacterium]|nr:DMT family protein [Flavobacteriales bacterium]